eukprot:2945145-Prymnesium_polylepis.1
MSAGCRCRVAGRLCVCAVWPVHTVGSVRTLCSTGPGEDSLKFAFPFGVGCAFGLAAKDVVQPRS